MTGRPDSEYVFACNACLFVTNNGPDLRKHLESNHARDLHNWCKWCGKAFSNVGDLVDHFPKEICDVRFEHKCGFEGCDYEDQDPTPFIMHMKTVHKKQLVKPCIYCRRLFTIPSSLVVHLQTECCNRPKPAPPAPEKPVSKPKIKKCTVEIEDCPKDKMQGKISKEKENDSKSNLKRKPVPSKTKSPKKVKPTEDEDEEVTDDNDEQKQRETFQAWSDWLGEIKKDKSADAIESLLKTDKIQDFFKCMQETCSFSTDDEKSFVSHGTKLHSGNQLKCLYCFSTFEQSEKLGKHMKMYHSKRSFQCSACLFRGSSKQHVELHQKSVHEDDDVTVISCKFMKSSKSSGQDNGNDSESHHKYRCSVASCEYSTLITEDFRNHFKQNHPKSNLFHCSCCKFESENVEDLVDHFAEKGVHEFKCMFCLFGSDEREEVELHACLNHADRKLVFWKLCSADGNDSGPVAAPSSIKKKRAPRGRGKGRS